MTEEFQRFFKKLFYKIDTSIVVAKGDTLVLSFPELAKSSFTASVTIEEPTSTIMAMKSFKASDPDGFQPIFFSNIRMLWSMMFGIWWLEPFPQALLIRD